jgi:hypothetical protein
LLLKKIKEVLSAEFYQKYLQLILQLEEWKLVFWDRQEEEPTISLK